MRILTDWFPAYMSPVYVGYYLTRYATASDRDNSPVRLMWWNGADWLFEDGTRPIFPREFMGLAFNPKNALTTNGWIVLGCAMTQGTGGGQNRKAA